MGMDAYLTGIITLRPSVTLRRAHKLVTDLSEYTGVSTWIKGVLPYKKFTDRRYLKDDLPNGRVVVFEEKVGEGSEHLCLYYHDVSMSSPMDESTWDDFEIELNKARKNLVAEVSLRLFYLFEADKSIHFADTM